MQVGVAANWNSGAATLQQLQADTADILKATFRQLRDKSLKARGGLLLILKELLTILPKCLDTHVEQLLPNIVNVLNVSH